MSMYQRDSRGLWIGGTDGDSVRTERGAAMRDEEMGVLPWTVDLGYGVRHVGLGESVTFWSRFLVSQRATPA